jgi:hypothetical protein
MVPAQRGFFDSLIHFALLLLLLLLLLFSDRMSKLHKCTQLCSTALQNVMALTAMIFQLATISTSVVVFIGHWMILTSPLTPPPHQREFPHCEPAGHSHDLPQRLDTFSRARFNTPPKSQRISFGTDGGGKDAHATLHGQSTTKHRHDDGVSRHAFTKSGTRHNII